MELLIASLTISAAMLLAALATILMYLRSRRSGGSSVGQEPYLCGEGFDDFRSNFSVGSINLFWGSTSATLKKFYYVLVERVHTGILNDWLVFIGLWFALAVVALFITTVVTGG